MILAVDLGGTKIEAALVDLDGTVMPGSRVRRATGSAIDAEHLRASIIEVVDAALTLLPAGTTLQGAGIGSAGPVSLDAGEVMPINMPGIGRFALRETVAERVHRVFPGAPVRLRHDGTCIALAESWVGAARGHDSSVSLVVSTGIGAGIIVAGRPVVGATGNAGHIGQTRIALTPDEGGGQTLEDVASGPNTVAWAQAQGWPGTSGEELARDAAAGDPLARAAAERSARAVGAVLANVVTLLDIDIAVIAGGFVNVVPDYAELAEAAMRERAVLGYARAARVVRSPLGDEGPLIGAAALIALDVT